MKKLLKYEHYCKFYTHALCLSFGIQDCLDFTKDKQLIESLRLIQERSDENVVELLKLCKAYNPEKGCSE